MKTAVEISTSGRGGSIVYREAGNTAGFDWEFALSPALALIMGAKAEHWDRRYPWAAGRQAEIYARVAADVVRQQSPGSLFDCDLASGIITIFEAGHRRSAGHETSQSAASAKQTSAASMHGELTADAVISLAALDTPEARASLDAALHHHLSADLRLAAAQALHAHRRLPNFEKFLIREIRQLDRTENGLPRALALARAHASDAVKQALLYASSASTACSPACAALLLALTGTPEPLDPATLESLEKLGTHANYFEHKAAFADLCSRVKMQIDFSAASG
jgi:hypothetical protein